jgi:hypothetical protein
MILSEDVEPKVVEALAGQLLSALLRVELAVAKSGFQYGGDVGPGGRQGRRFRVECKAYRESTALNERELLGEIDQAIDRDEALEAWVLVATRSVPEQMRQSLTQHGERLGVPVIILSWAEDYLSTLAALCTTNTDIVNALISPDAADLAKKLAPYADTIVDEIKMDLQSWSVGFDSIRTLSHARLAGIWTTPTIASAVVGQNVAIGTVQKKIKRTKVSKGLDEWWNSIRANGSPTAIIGAEGTGKTWATLSWIFETLNYHPIALFIPAAAVAGSKISSEESIKDFIAGCIHDLTGERSRSFWNGRVSRLLSRPSDEGPVLTIVFDGINQEPSTPWLQLISLLQTPTFAPYIACIITTRHFHLGTLGELKRLIQPAYRIEVQGYEDIPGGEFDQMLAMEGLVRTDLPADLLELARNPRLFRLVISLKDRLATAGHVTVHRLLWEYGKDTFGERGERSFTEREWKEYLQDVAQDLKAGTRAFTSGEISKFVERGYLNPNQVFSRLSDIVDGRFMRESDYGFEFVPEMVAHSLAIALIKALTQLKSADKTVMSERLASWLDPIAGLDERSEILRAVTTILIDTGATSKDGIAGPILTAWLQTQNLPEEHRHEVCTLASEILHPLFDAIEHSRSHANASARFWAVTALRNIKRTDFGSYAVILDRLAPWLSTISRDVRNDKSTEGTNYDAQRKSRLIERIGTDVSGPIIVLGHDMSLVDSDDGTLKEEAAAIIEGFPLRPAVPLIELAVISATGNRGGRSVDAFKWLLLLNERDPEETALDLRNAVDSIKQRIPEPGLHKGFRNQVVAKMLRMTGYEADDHCSNLLKPTIDFWDDYEGDYLNSPATSYLRLERRHVESVLADASQTVLQRLHRSKSFLIYREISVPEGFSEELELAAEHIDLSLVDSTSSHTRADYDLEELGPLLARCAPDLLEKLHKDWLLALKDSSPEQRYWRGKAAHERLMLSDDECRRSAQALRTKFIEKRTVNETHAASHLLMLEIEGLGAYDQAVEIIEANVEMVYADFCYLLSTPSKAELETLVGRYKSGTENQQQSLLSLLSIYDAEFSATVLQWVETQLSNDDQNGGHVAFRILATHCPERLARVLLDSNWSWSGEKHYWVNHYGSDALIAGGLSRSFQEIAPKLAPWKLLEAVRKRGGRPEEVTLALEIFDRVIKASSVPEVDPGAEIAVKLNDWNDFPSFYSASPREEDFGNDDFERFQKGFDDEAQNRIWNQAVKTAHQRIKSARTTGANLYLSSVGVEDLEVVWAYHPTIFDEWIDGAHSNSSDFRRRVSLASGVFLSVCELLLNNAPEKGAVLWRAMNRSLTSRYIGPGKVDELTHIAFRCRDSQQVEALREDMFDVRNCSTDKRLRELAFAATFNKRQDWLLKKIEKDHASKFAWRQLRAVVLEGFAADDSVAIPDLRWSEGPWISRKSFLQDQANDRLRRSAASRYWWNELLSAETDRSAWAAWILFLESCDRASLTSVEVGHYAVSRRGVCRRYAHALLNRASIRRQSDEHEKKLGQTFLGEDLSEGIGPWRNFDNV